MEINEKLQAALTQVIGRTVDGIDASVDFLSQQLPDVIQQLLVWKFLLHFIEILLPLVILIYSGRKLWKFINEYLERVADYNSHEYWEAKKARDAAYKAYLDASLGDKESHQRLAYAHNAACEALAKISKPDLPPYRIGMVLHAVIAAPALVATLIGWNLYWLQILVAPKVYLIEYAASLAK